LTGSPQAFARGEHARELGKQARDSINADFDVDNPSTPPRVSQKLIAAAALLGALPTPSTPEARNLHRELGRSPPVDSNELFDIATSFASSEEAVGAIFDGKKGKRVDDAPAEGSKSKEP
jgi:hypothetical protein